MTNELEMNRLRHKILTMLTFEERIYIQPLLDKCLMFATEESNPQGDLISRSALKEKVSLMWGDNSHVTESMYEIIDNTSTVERPTGYWIDTGIVNWEGFLDFECSSCHKCDTREETEKYVPFCKYCGADMRGISE